MIFINISATYVVIFLGVCKLFDEIEKPKKKKVLKKITPQRLRNIALYYLKRYETSTANLRQVLRKRVNDYAFYNKEFDKQEAYAWIEDIVADFLRYGYVNDERFAEIKIRDYKQMGKSVRYIKAKLKEKGLSDDLVEQLLETQDYDELEAALKFARKKRIGRFRATDKQAEYKQKDMAALARAGFSYDVVCEVCQMHEDF